MFLVAEFGRDNITLMKSSSFPVGFGRGAIFPRFCIRNGYSKAIVRFDTMEIECTDAMLKKMIQIVFKRATGTTRPLIRYVETVI